MEIYAILIYLTKQIVANRKKLDLGDATPDINSCSGAQNSQNFFLSYCKNLISNECYSRIKFLSYNSGIKKVMQGFRKISFEANKHTNLPLHKLRNSTKFRDMFIHDRRQSWEIFF